MPKPRPVTFFVLPDIHDRTTILGAFDTLTDAQHFRESLRRREGIEPAIRVASEWPKGEAPRFI